MAVLSPLNVRVMLRHDTLANWEQYDPIPLIGEACFAIDANILKIGDGERHWSELPPVAGEGSYVPANYYVGVAEAEESDMEAIERILNGATPKKEDVCIVKRLIAEEKYSYNLYVYNESEWLACNGLYNAKDVYFDQDFVVTKDIGEISLNGANSVILEAEGRNLVDVMDTILKKERNPKVVQPAWTVEFTNLPEKHVTDSETSAYEKICWLPAGKTFTLKFEKSFNPGSHEFGPATEIQPQDMELHWYNNTSDDYADEILDPDATQIEVLSSRFYEGYVYAHSGCTEGTMPVTNLGNDYPAGQIHAKTYAWDIEGSTSAHLWGYLPIYYGMLGEKVLDDNGGPEDIDWDPILRGSNNYTDVPAAWMKNKVLPELKAKSILNAKCAWVAIPSDADVWGMHTTLKRVTMPSAMNLDITSEWTKAFTDVRIYENPDDQWSWALYDVYVYQPAHLDSTESYQIELA